MGIGTFDVGKGLGKFFGGVVAAALAMLVADPSIITRLIPEQWGVLTLTGLVVEAIDFLYSKYGKK